LSDNSASRHLLRAMNNKYIDQGALWFPQGGATNSSDGARPADEVRTEINAHGVTIVELEKAQDGKWSHVEGSPYNKRYTSATPMTLSGPVVGSEYVTTKYSPDGTL